MSEYESCSDECRSENDDDYESISRFLTSFKLVTTPFSQPNIAKQLRESEELSKDQSLILETQILSKGYSSLSSDMFMSIAREDSDIRSFRVLFEEVQSTAYDYSLMCLDFYFHTLKTPSIVLRTGLGKVSLSSCFDSNGVVTEDFWKDFDRSDLEATEFSIEKFILMTCQNLIFYSNKFLYPSNDESSDQELEVYKHIVEYASFMYGIRDMIVNPIPELKSSIRAFFIVSKKCLRSHLSNLINSEFQCKFEESSLAFKKNPALAAELNAREYLIAFKELIQEVISLLDGLPTIVEEFGEDYEVRNLITLKEASQNDPTPPESSSVYFQTLKDLRFSNYDFWSAKNHVLIDKTTETFAANTNRLSKEVRVLSQHLPCESTGAIFVSMDEERMDLMKALVSGTDDTPYAHGLYEFHIACPSEYPKNPPLVRITTTGKGKVRFNPNLYDDGYVCLSVINTWDGDPSERWNPAHSNILQVLLSIQVLVMDNMVVQKEPDFEHLALNSPENQIYSGIVKYNNVKYAMLGMLQNPPPEFKEAVWRHFALKRNEVMITIDKWLEEAKTFETPTANEDMDYLVMDHNSYTCNLFRSYSYYSLLLEVRNELLKKLDSLPSLDIPRQPFSIIEMTEDMEKLGGYYKKFKDFIFIEKELCEAGGYRHSLGRYLPPLSQYNKNQERFSEEIRLLKDVKCKPNNNFFVVVDSERQDLIKLLVPGPADSDYDNGLFLFDIACGEGFPETAPKVELITTGRFTVSFHKQLTRTGDVTGLTWTPETKLLDYFTQIQDIFTKDPLESLSPDEKKIKKIAVKYNTLRFAIYDMVKYPPEDFKEVCKAHFQMKKRDIFVMFETYFNDLSEFGSEFSEYDWSDNVETFEMFKNLGVANAIDDFVAKTSEAFEYMDEKSEPSEESDSEDCNIMMNSVKKKNKSYEMNSESTEIRLAIDEKQAKNVTDLGVISEELKE